MGNRRRTGFGATVHGLGTIAATSALLLSAPAAADFTVTPYADVRQVVSKTDGRDARGSLDVGAGITARADTSRLDGSFSYRYSRRIEEFGEIGRRNRHNATADIRADLIQDFLTLNAGGSASQYATDLRGDNSFDGIENSGNQTQVFSGFVEPRVRQRLGDFATFDANYRLSAVSADGPREDGQLRSNIGLDPTDGLGALLSDSVTHSGGVVVASTRATNTFNWSLLANATREDINQLNQEYRGYSAGGEIGIRITRKIELTASGGYEDIENTQDSILFDPITQLPILDADGNFQVDPAQPRRTAFDFSGEYWNVGFRYTPSRRTMIEIRAGERYGDPNVFANISYTARNGINVNGQFQQTLSSFGRLIGFYDLETGALVGANRAAAADDFVGEFCGFVSDDGECLFRLFAIASPATFKSDRGSLSVSRRVNAISWLVSAFFDKRRYVDSQQLQSPLTPPTTLFGSDRSIGVRGRVSLSLDQRRTLAFDTALSRNDFALTAARKDYRLLGGVSYGHTLNQRLSASASLFASKRFSNTSDDRASVTASAGLRYRF